jgi:hypothetical protein
MATRPQDPPLLSVVKKILEPPSKPYLRAPLALLRYGETPLERMEILLDYCLFEVGESYLEKLRNLASIEELAPIMHRAYQAPLDAEKWAFFIGCKILRVASPNPWEVRKGPLLKLKKWILRQPKNEQNATITIPTNLFWACLDHLRGDRPDKWIDWDRFRVLMAIGSKLGKKRFGKCGWREIQCRADGRLTKYKEGQKTRIHETGTPNDALTRYQIRRLVDRLVKGHWIARITKKGETYFGIGISTEALADKIIEAKNGKNSGCKSASADNERHLKRISEAVQKRAVSSVPTNDQDFANSVANLPANLPANIN